jgi:BON domain
MKNFGKFIIVSSLCVASFACAQNYQNGQYPGGQYSNQPYQSNQPGQYQQSEGDYGGGYGAGNQGNSQQKQGSWSNWFGGNQNQNVPDNVISTRVMQNLRSTPYLSDGAQNLQVTTKEGKVSLKGKVANSNEKNQIEYMVKNVEGVKSVSNNLDTAQ